MPRSRLFSSVALAMLVVAPNAQAQHYIDLPGTQPGGLAMGEPLDTARSCGTSCHFSRDDTVPSAMPYDGYVGSMMGNAMRDPLFLAALTVAEQDSPGVGDFCLRCHTPPGFVGGRTRSSATAARGTDLTSEDLDGVTCDSCHRMVTTANRGNAQYELSPTDVRFGPYPVIDSIRHHGAVSDWLPRAEMCGTCHTVNNPRQPQLAADGTPTGVGMPLDSTYSEWANSVYAQAGTADAKVCQDCHMQRFGSPTMVSSNNTAMLRDNPRQHLFVGGNAWAIRVLGQMRNDESTGVFYAPDLVPFYENSARRAEAQLGWALGVEVRDAPSEAMPGQTISFVVRVTNHAGHRIPTGYADGRRVWLEVAVVESGGRETVVSGAYDTTEARLGVDPQLKVYEAHFGVHGMGVNSHLALQNTVISDTRLPPRGYRPPRGLEPVGVDYSGGENGALRHWDDTRYSVTVPATARGPVTLRVRARYQTTTREYVEHLVEANHTDDRGRELLRRYEASGRAAPFTMKEVNVQVITPGGVVTDGGIVADGGTMADSGTVRDGSVGIDGSVVGPAEASGGCSCRTQTTQSNGSLRGMLSVLLGGVVLSLSRRRSRR